MNIKKTVFNKLKKNRTELSKKVDLGLIDEFSYGTYEDMQQEVDNLNYFTQEWFPEKFDQWFDLGREIYSIYFQRGEPLLTEEDFNTDQNCELICTSCDLGTLTEKDQKICPVNAGVIQYCPINSSWADWAPWGYCSADCGPSFKRRMRGCVDGKYGGSTCSNRFDIQEEKCDKKVRIGSLFHSM